MVGVLVGKRDGADVLNSVGRGVGTREGRGVGMGVGKGVGRRVGLRVGRRVGLRVGTAEGGNKGGISSVPSFSSQSISCDASSSPLPNTWT